MNRYTNLAAWFDGYVAPTLKMVHKALAQDGIYGVNIADYKNGKEQFAIVDQWKVLSEKIGFEYCEQVNMMLNVRPGVGNNRDTKIHKSEGVYIFRKRH
jgi:hypothetical protein